MLSWLLRLISSSPNVSLGVSLFFVGRLVIRLPYRVQRFSHGRHICLSIILFCYCIKTMHTVVTKASPLDSLSPFFCQIRPWTNLIGHIGCKKIDNYYILLTGHCFIQCCIFNTGQECVVGQVQKKGSQTDGTIRTESSEILWVLFRLVFGVAFGIIYWHCSNYSLIS